MPGGWVFSIRSRKIGWHSGQKYRKNLSNSESILMSSFIQGLDILLRQLRSLDTANRPRVDQAIIDRIERLRIDGAEQVPSPTPDPVEMSSSSSPDPVEAISGSSVGVVREDAHRVAKPDEQELVPSQDHEQRIAKLREKVLVCIKCPHLAESR